MEENLKEGENKKVINLNSIDNKFSGDLSILIAFYNSIQNDITNYRNWEWKVTVYYTLLSTGVLSFATSDKVKPYLSENFSILHIGFIIFQILVLIFSIYHLWKIHTYLTENRQLRRKIEKIFKFDKEGVYFEESILPNSWKKKHPTFSFEFNVFVAPFMIFLIIYEVFVTFYILFLI